MKLVGVVTFHRANSFGATLQAYATHAFLNQNGYKEILKNMFPVPIKNMIEKLFN